MLRAFGRADRQVERGVIVRAAPGGLLLRRGPGDKIRIALTDRTAVWRGGARVRLRALRPGRAGRGNPRRERDGPRDRHPAPGAGDVTKGGTILLVEDEEDIASLVRAYLERDGFRVVWATRGTEGLQALEQHDVRLAILDLQLPDTDGFDLCRAIRVRVSRVPVVMLTARDEEIDRVTGLELGADDYVTKPFSPRELVARVRAVLRRAEPEDEHDTLVSGDVVLDRRARTAVVAGMDVELTSREFELVWHLAERPGVVVSRERLLERVWGLAFPGGTRTVDVHVGQLRRKLDRPELIRTVRGAGYKLVRALTLRSRLFLGIAGTVLVSLVVTVVAGALLTRRSLEQSAIGALERQVELIAAQRASDVERDGATSLGQFLATEQQRLAILTPAQAELLLPAGGAARIRDGLPASGSVEVRGERFLYAARRNGPRRSSCFAPPSGRRRTGGRSRSVSVLAGLVGAALAALVALRPRPRRRAPDRARLGREPRARDRRAARTRSPSKGRRRWRGSRRPSTSSRTSSSGRRRPSGPSCSR